MFDPDEDDFFKEYRAKLMHQMQQRLNNSYVNSIPRMNKSISFDSSSRFGQQIDLNRDSFTHAIDDENKNVTIIVHVYEQVCSNQMNVYLIFEFL
jgi:hypothetical protein